MRILIISMIVVSVVSASGFLLFFVNRVLGKAFAEIDRRRKDNE
jgi:hypothetical protein